MTRDDDLERGRRGYQQRTWREAHDSLRQADSREPLAGSDLEKLAISAFMIGSEMGFIDAIARAHHAYAADGSSLAAIRSAAWAGLGHLQRGEVGPATGWFRRATRLLEHEDDDAVEHGYPMIPVVISATLRGDFDEAAELAGEVVKMAQQHGDIDLFSLASCERGRAVIRGGRPAEGLPLLDDAMITVTTGDVSPMVAGVVYCSVIEGCHEAFAMERADEWTDALVRWCDTQTDLVQFTGRCHIHRAEMLQFHGAWSEAVEAAHRSRTRMEELDDQGSARAWMRLAELHRVCGRLPEAEEAYRETARKGGNPQPGLALLRLAQGDTSAAVTAIRRTLAETPRPLDRARLLPASVEIHLAADETADAHTAAEELAAIARDSVAPHLKALAALATGVVALHDGDPMTALTPLRRANAIWHELDAPYEAARARCAIARACEELGDHDTAAFELARARETFETLGAILDLARINSESVPAPSGLTEREIEVLRLVAAGSTSKQVADSLYLSPKTIDRHLSNIFTKLDVRSRTAAVAFAYEHGLI